MLETKIEALRLRLRNKVFLPYGAEYRGKKLKNRNFTIISNNCWGGTIYESYNVVKQSPIIGMFIMPEDYLKMLGNLRYYLSLEPIFITTEASKWKSRLSIKKNWGTYLIAELGDIELHMLHYHNQYDALEKWKRRRERIIWDKMIVKFNDQNGCTEKQIEQFWRLPFNHKICFVSRESFLKGNSILIKQPKGYKAGVCASREPYGESRYINVTKLINEL